MASLPSFASFLTPFKISWGACIPGEFWDHFVTFKKKYYWCFLVILLNPLDKHVLSTYCVPGSVLGAGNTAEKKRTPLAWWQLLSSGGDGRQKSKKIISDGDMCYKKRKQGKWRTSGWLEEQGALWVQWSEKISQRSWHLNWNLHPV